MLLTFGDLRETIESGPLCTLKRPVGRNKHAVGKVLKNIKRADPNKAVQGGFFFKINKPAGQIAIKMYRKVTQKTISNSSALHVDR